MSFPIIIPKQSSLSRIRYHLLSCAQIEVPAHLCECGPAYMMLRDERRYVAIGLHAFTVIGEYIFLYEDWKPISCLHLLDDWRQVISDLILIIDHSSTKELPIG